MTAYLISLALAGLIVIVLWETFRMSADIIQFIPRPKRVREPTDFPTIVFRSRARSSRRSSMSTPHPANISHPTGPKNNAQGKAVTKSARWRAATPGRRSMCWSASCGSKDATAAARIAAANAILDRGWGKATQAIENGEDGALELIHRIERVIVHPENPDSEIF